MKKDLIKDRIFQSEKKILEYTVTIFIDYVDQRALRLRVEEEFISNYFINKVFLRNPFFETVFCQLLQ